MKRLLCIAIFCFPLMSPAQESGIRWTTGLSWEQVKQKAKQENKFIFLDCYTTWCGPCKMMDQSTYINDTVGDYFNNKFISVKVQFDRTERDHEHTKLWYADVDSIGKKYHVEGYPTYIFFTPQGDIVHKAMGFRHPSDFIAVATIATVPGKVYDNEYAHYDEFVQSYKRGEKNYNEFPAMIKMAFKGNDTAIGFQLQKELRQYMSGLPRQRRYTKDRIEMWASFSIPSGSSVFNFFYKDASFIDRVMGHRGYAGDIVDRTIQEEICLPYMEEQSKPSGIAMHGMYLSGPGLTTDSSEADWQKLHAIIKRKFGKSYANRSTLTAKIDWYGRHRNQPEFVKNALHKLEKYPPDFNDLNTCIKVNSICWNAFLKFTDKKVLARCIPWMENVIKHDPFNTVEWIDTYANLLYKVGRKDEAIQWEEKAADLYPAVFKQIVEDMKKNKPTHLVYDAVWTHAK